MAASAWAQCIEKRKKWSPPAALGVVKSVIDPAKASLAPTHQRGVNFLFGDLKEVVAAVTVSTPMRFNTFEKFRANDGTQRHPG